MVFKKPCQQAIEMVLSTRSLDQRVRTPWVGHEVERFGKFDQPIHQQFSTLIMHVVIPRAVDQEEVAAQTVCEIDG